MATSDNKSFSVAKVAYDAPDVATFSAQLDSNLATVKVKTKDETTGKMVETGEEKQVRRTASASANLTDDAQFWTLMHHPLIASRGRYEDGDLSYITRYALGLALAEADGTLKVSKEVRDGIVQQLDAERAAAKAAQSERMKGMGGATTKEAFEKAKQFDKVLAMLTDEQKAALGLS